MSQVSLLQTYKNYVFVFFLLLVLLAFIFFFFFSEVLWCVDDLSDQARAAWNNKVITLKSNIDYWSDQVLAYDQMLDHLENIKNNMSNEEYLQKKAELLKESHINRTNVNSDIRMLDHLQKSGPDSASVAESSNSAKRVADSLGEASSNKKR